MKIIFLGDSLTWGRYGGDFVAEVAKRLPQHEIINAGESGSTVLNLAQRLDDLLEQSPDGMFVMVGGNDAISYSQPETRRYYEQVQKVPGGAVTPEMYIQTYRDLLTTLQAHHVLTWVGLAPLEHNPAVVETLAQYNQLAREAAEALNLPVLDLTAHFPAPQPVPERPPLDQATINLIGKRVREGWTAYEAARERGGYTFTFDGLHLTPEAAVKAGEIVADFLSQY